MNPDSRGETTTVSTMMEPFETDNKYLLALFAHPLFGQAPNGALDALDKLATRHADEQLITAIRAVRPPTQMGMLMLTTHFLRYVKRGRVLTIGSSDDLWSLEDGVG